MCIEAQSGAEQYLAQSVTQGVKGNSGTQNCFVPHINFLQLILKTKGLDASVPRI